MTKVLGRRRLLLSAVAEGAGLDAMFRLMGREIGADCWLLTGTGRVVGGTGPSLPRPIGGQAGLRVPEGGPAPGHGAGQRAAGPEAGEGKYSLFGVGGEPRITSWFLAAPGHEQDWVQARAARIRRRARRGRRAGAGQAGGRAGR